MSLLSEPTSTAFLNRFFHFNDALLRKVEITYSTDGSRRVVLLVASRDCEATENSGWICVRIEVLDVQDFCFSEQSNTTAMVLSNGLHVVWFGTIIGIELGHLVDSPESPMELQQSRLFATGLTVRWSVEPFGSVDVPGVPVPLRR